MPLVPADETVSTPRSEGETAVSKTINVINYETAGPEETMQERWMDHEAEERQENEEIMRDYVDENR